MWSKMQVMHFLKYTCMHSKKTPLPCVLKSKHIFKIKKAEAFLLHFSLLFFCSWVNHYVLIRVEYGSVCRALYKYYFFPLLLCIHSTCVGLQAPNLKEKLSQSQQTCCDSWGQNFAVLSAYACFLSENINQVKSTCSLAHVRQKMFSTCPMFCHL